MGKICLAIVVANERPVIERCLDSTKNLIDQICISINEDNDGTEECIKEWGKRNNIPTITWFDPWDGYGPNKTRNLAKVREELDTEYIIFLDADEVFITNPDDSLSYPTAEDGERLKKELDANPNVDVFYMKTHFGPITYSRWQIVRNNQEWIWHLPFQECLLGEKSNVRYDIDWIYNKARHEGHSSRHDDLPKNIKLLEKWLEENKDDLRFKDRVNFYLGQAYKDGLNYDTAIIYLEERMRGKGWYEEKYMSGIYLADIYELKMEFEKRRNVLLKCIDINPNRLEAYFRLMMDDFNKKDYRKAIAWSIMAPNSRVIPEGIFLAQKDLYKYRFDYIISLIAYYAAGKRSDSGYDDKSLYRYGLDAIERCITQLPSKQMVITTQKNKQFYVQKLPEENSDNSNNSNLNDALKTIKRGFTEMVTTLDIVERPIVNYTEAHKNTKLIVIDDFYVDPMKIRNLALKMNFKVSGNYPGLRTEPYIEDGMKERLESIVGAKITYWPSSYNGSFQYTTEENKSWLHRDATDWSVVIYLTPDAPVDGGTKLYVHKKTGLTRTYNDEEEELLNKDSYNFDAWDMIDRVGNRFNRCVLFRGRHTHISDRYFGTCLEDGRLFQTFFFNT